MKSVTVEQIQSIITTKLEQLLMVDPGYIDLDTPVSVYGADSLMRAALVDEVESQLGLAVPASEFHDNPTVRDIAQHLHEAITGN
ncbi:acyl carrier protein [Saccharomonospora viridis]|uniref:Phosphopantetheine-containing protein n=2 Tax=Saccharomonospora viridis TaxID=1852 RepID=C7MTP5_SACVD|nr:acyl carrier protein [Saccharomonospora viridis]ACU96778.1 phosphopantetheine-containing protein [Saccharomonospora viridis DSM 43017]KHF42952.1 phosphopantetheine-containing protein [Saccharomonospora viridis]SFO87658.1 Acyl carrier protein [Saccharomonospora viridis]